MCDTDPKPDDVFDIPACRQCITGEGGECHNPGCSFFIFPAPPEGCNNLGTVCMEMHKPNALGRALARLEEVDTLSMVAELHTRLGAYVNDGHATAYIPDSLRDLRVALLREEFAEYMGAAYDRDLVGVADGLADIVYVAYGTALTYGIQLDAVLAEVHRSNMTKERAPDGGKFVKGPAFSPPDIPNALRRRPEPK